MIPTVQPKRSVTFTSAFKDIKERISQRNKDNSTPNLVASISPATSSTTTPIPITSPSSRNNQNSELNFSPPSDSKRSLLHSHCSSLPKDHVSISTPSSSYQPQSDNFDDQIPTSPTSPTKTSESPNLLRRSFSVPTGMQGNIKVNPNTPTRDNLIINTETNLTLYDEMTLRQLSRIPHLDYDIFNNNLILRAGKFSSLVECLILINGVFELETFFLAYRQFVKPQELFQIIVDIFNTYCEEDAKIKRGSDNKRNLPLPLLKQKIFAFLRHWLDSGIRSSLMKPKEKSKKDNDHCCRNIYVMVLDFAQSRLGNDQANILKLIYLKSCKNKLSTLYNREKDLYIESQINPSISPKNTLNILDVQPKDIAEQITLIDLSLFRRVLPTDFFSSGFVNSSSNGAPQNQAESLWKITQQFNKITAWVATEIVSAETLDKQILIFKKFVSVANRLLELRNFHALLEIVLGLNHYSVARLKPLQKALTQKYKESLRKYEAIVSPNGNYKAYRTLLRSCNYCIPILAVFQRDMIYLHEGNPTYVSGAQKSNLEGQILNFEKLRNLSEMVFTYLASFSSPYCSPAMLSVPNSSSSSSSPNPTSSTPPTSPFLHHNNPERNSMSPSNKSSSLPHSSNIPVPAPPSSGSTLSMSGSYLYTSSSPSASSSSSSSCLFTSLVKLPILFAYLVEVQPLSEDKLQAKSLSAFDPNSTSLRNLIPLTAGESSLSSQAISPTDESSRSNSNLLSSPLISPSLSPASSPTHQNLLNGYPSSFLLPQLSSPSPSPPVLRKETVGSPPTLIHERAAPLVLQFAKS